MQSRILTQVLAVTLVAATLTLGSGCSIFQKKNKNAPGSGAGGSLPPTTGGIDLGSGDSTSGGRFALGSGTEQRGLFAPVYFDYDSAQIKNQLERAKVVAVADALKGNSKKLLIEGHCDERGTAEYNRALGERRAQNTRAELVRLGIDGNRISTISFGKDKPVDLGHGDTAWSRNRRCEFVLIN